MSRLSFKQFLDAKGSPLSKYVQIDYNSMTAEALEKYIELRREHGADKPIHKISMNEIVAIYENKLSN